MQKSNGGTAKSVVKEMKDKIEHPLSQAKAAKRRPAVRLISAAILFVVAVGLLTVVVTVVGAYSKHWNNGFVQSFSGVIPFPAVTVNGNWVSYHEFLDRVNALEKSYSTAEGLAASGLSAKPPRDQIEGAVLDRLAKDEIVRQLAAARGVAIEQSAIDAVMRDIVAQSGSEQEVEAKLQQLYGWTSAVFAQRVVEPFLIRQRLQEKIAMDDTINSAELAKLNAALARVKDQKEDFGTVAGSVNEDQTRTTQGDWGIFAHGDLDQAVEEVAFALEPGQISDLVRTSEGYHVLKLLEKITADPAKDQGEQVHLAHIFIAAKQLDGWLFEQASSQRVAIFLSGYRWDKTVVGVVPSNANTNTSTPTTNTSTPDATNVNAAP